MITNEGKRICDKEIKNKFNLWCACKKPAKIKISSKAVKHLELDFCKKHAPKIILDNLKQMR